MTPTTVDETIKALDELFDSPERWTKRAMARDKDGFSTYPWKDNACCWCLSGGIYKILGTKPATSKLVELAGRELRRRIGGSITYFNDRTDTDFKKMKSILK